MAHLILFFIFQNLSDGACPPGYFFPWIFFLEFILVGPQRNSFASQNSSTAVFCGKNK
jgi:hypothetical protein